MEKTTYQNMYNHIKMTEEQKREILQSVEKRTRNTAMVKYRFSYYVIACFCIISLSGITIYAAKHFDVAARIEEAFEQLLNKELDVSEEQKEIYSEYSTILGNEIDLGGGKLELEAVLYDARYLYIPFTVSDIDTSYSDDKLSDITFGLKGKENCDMNQYRYTKETNDDGTIIKGNYIVIFPSDILNKGDIIQVLSNNKENVITEFELSNDIEDQVVKMEVGKVEGGAGINLSEVIISPLSLSVQGTYTDIPISYSSLSVKLKDGTIVKQANTGQSSGFTEKDGIGKNEFYAQVLFETPINIKDVDSILLDTGEQEVEIELNK